jgi:hypothetical protein
MCLQLLLNGFITLHYQLFAAPVKQRIPLFAYAQIDMITFITGGFQRTDFDYGPTDSS